MAAEPGWYEDAERADLVRYWNGREWTGDTRPNYPPVPDVGTVQAPPAPVAHATGKAMPALVFAALAAATDIAIVPVGSSPFRDTEWAGYLAIAVPFGTLLAIVLLLCVRGLRLPWARGVAIAIGLLMLFSFPIGVGISTLTS